MEFIFDTYAHFHFLLHLLEPDESAIDKLRSMGISEDRIQLQLSTPGSRFFPDFANDLESLATRLKDGKYETLTEANGNIRIVATADLSSFPNGCGTNAVIPFDSLTIQQQKNIFLKRNRGFLVQHLLVNELPSTPHFMIILKPLKRGLKLITAFPGEHAMPMPHHGMKPALYKACKEFWEQHVILLNE